MSTTKPNWLQMRERAEAAIRQATIECAAAYQMRCKSEDLRGEQCTADAFPQHQHTYPVAEREDEDGQ